VVNGDGGGREVERIPLGQVVTSVIMEAKWESSSGCNPEIPLKGDWSCRKRHRLAGVANGNEGCWQVERLPAELDGHFGDCWELLEFVIRIGLVLEFH
jgi:hypothetical protein